LLIAIFISFLFTSTLTYFFKDYAFSRAIILILYLMLLILLSMWRIIAKILLKYPRASRRSLFEAGTIIVGTNDSAVELIRRLKRTHNFYYDILGLIDIDRKRIGEKINDVEIIGSIDAIGKIIRAKKVNEVIFASDFLSYQDILKIVAANQGQSTQFHLVDKNYDFIIGKKDVMELDDLPLIEIEYNIAQPIHRYLKRMFDVIVSLALLILIYPFLFSIGLVSNKKNKLLYLPKVISGKYSLVGPPINGTGSSIYLGKPGLTGIVQINENKNLSSEEIEHMNIYYARNQNIWLDVEIIIKQIQNLVR
jgi:hypothetical protein